MSLEQALADNTAALKALTAALADPVRITLPTVLQLEQAQTNDRAHMAVDTHPQPTVAPVPPPPPVPSTAVAPPPPTAPVAPTVTSPEPTTAFAPAAAPSVAPVTPAAPPTASPVAAGDRDKNGLPWDGRIHASSKALVADGSWRMKRGVDATLVTQVTAELQAAAAAPLPRATDMPWPFATSQADVMPLPVPPPPPAAPVTSAYAVLMSRLTHHINVGDIKPQQVTDECIKLGVPSIAALATREDLVPYVASALGLPL